MVSWSWISEQNAFGGASAVDTGDICNQDQVRYKEVCVLLNY